MICVCVKGRELDLRWEQEMEKQGPHMPRALFCHFFKSGRLWPVSLQDHRIWIHQVAPTSHSLQIHRWTGRTLTLSVRSCMKPPQPYSKTQTVTRMSVWCYPATSFIVLRVASTVFAWLVAPPQGQIAQSSIPGFPKQHTERGTFHKADTTEPRAAWHLRLRVSNSI